MSCIFKFNFVNICVSKDHYFLHINYSRINSHFHVQSCISVMFVQSVIFFCMKLNIPSIFFKMYYVYIQMDYMFENFVYSNI